MNDADQGLMLAGALLLGALIAGGLLFWWFGRQLKLSALKLERVEKARQFAAQQAAQARKQVEQLQKELGELRQAHGIRTPRTAAHVELAPAASAEPLSAAQVAEALPLVAAPPRPPAAPDGFADTQIQLPHQR